VTTVEELKQYFKLSPQEERDFEKISQNHPINIPRYYLSLIDPDDPDDPIKKLAIPTSDELVDGVGTTDDPYGDDKHDKGNGVLHKYPYSALVVATEYCPMYCRHCFRKRLVGLETDKTVDDFEEASRYIRNHPEITNVIISGGDPFLLGTERIKKMLGFLKDIPHINYVRIGSRAVLTYPLRFLEPELIEVLREFNQHKTLYVPTHFNHAREITEVSKQAVMNLRNAGITVNNQAVFLRGVNDSEEALEDLMNGLVRIGVNPYYLYQTMPVAHVAKQFQIPLKEGVDIVSNVKRKLDGYAKRFKFIMGHDIGKIEIVGRTGDKLIMSQIHARPEYPEEASRILVRKLTDTATWLDDLPEVAL
jgi:lysine 2,3-aminomutase